MAIMMPSKAISEMQAILGPSHLITDIDEMQPYLTDWRQYYVGQAAAVVKPATAEEVAEIIKLAQQHQLTITPQGGNTSLCGGATPEINGKGLVLCLGRLNKIRSINTKSQTIIAESGCIVENIQNVAAQYDLIFPLDFGARGQAQIGGALSTNAGGLNVVRYGMARQICLGLEVVTPEGEICDLLSSLKKNNTGYDLKQLFIGAEGTLGIITAASLQLLPRPQNTATAWAAVQDINDAISLMQRLNIRSAGHITAFEIMPQIIIDNVRKYYPHVSVPLTQESPFHLLIETSVSVKEEDFPLSAIMESTLADAIEDDIITDAIIAQSIAQQRDLWEMRELIPPSEIKAGPAYKSDISVPIEHMQNFYKHATNEADKIVPNIRVFGFGHLGDGNLHFNLAMPEHGYPNFESYYPQFDTMLIDLLLKYNGVISAEHGIGQKKREMLAKTKDKNAIAMMRKIKRALDPNNIMNPNKIINFNEE